MSYTLAINTWEKIVLLLGTSVWPIHWQSNQQPAENADSKPTHPVAEPTACVAQWACRALPVGTRAKLSEKGLTNYQKTTTKTILIVQKHLKYKLLSFKKKLFLSFKVLLCF